MVPLRRKQAKLSRIRSFLRRVKNIYTMCSMNFVICMLQLMSSSLAVSLYVRGDQSCNFCWDVEMSWCGSRWLRLALLIAALMPVAQLGRISDAHLLDNAIVCLRVFGSEWCQISSVGQKHNATLCFMLFHYVCDEISHSRRSSMSKIGQKFIALHKTWSMIYVTLCIYMRHW